MIDKAQSSKSKWQMKSKIKNIKKFLFYHLGFPTSARALAETGDIYLTFARLAFGLPRRKLWILDLRYVMFEKLMNWIIEWKL